MLVLINWTGIALVCVFTLYCISCGLFVLGKIIEANHSNAKRSLYFCLLLNSLLHVSALIFESGVVLPKKLLLFSLASSLMYVAGVPHFPCFKLSSPSFLACFVASLVNHFLWFDFFTHKQTPLPQVVSFYFVLVWFVPSLVIISSTSTAFDAHELPSYTSIKTTSGAFSSDAERASLFANVPASPAASSYVKQPTMIGEIAGKLGIDSVAHASYNKMND